MVKTIMCFNDKIICSTIGDIKENDIFCIGNEKYIIYKISKYNEGLLSSILDDYKKEYIDLGKNLNINQIAYIRKYNQNKEKQHKYTNPIDLMKKCIKDNDKNGR